MVERSTGPEAHRIQSNFVKGTRPAKTHAVLAAGADIVFTRCRDVERDLEIVGVCIRRDAIIPDAMGSARTTASVDAGDIACSISI